MPERPCDNAIRCLCASPSESPFANFSAEAADPITFFSFQFAEVIPLLGDPPQYWGRTSGPAPGYSPTSQVAADELADAAAMTAILGTRRNPLGLAAYFTNHATQCEFPCPTGYDTFVYAVPAGTVVAITQEEADAIAASLCQFQGRLVKECVPTPPKIAPPLAWWKMTNAAAGTQSDIIANWPLVRTVVSGAMTSVAGKVNQGIQMSGTPVECYYNKFITTPFNAPPFNGVAIEVTGWFKIVSSSPAINFFPIDARIGTQASAVSFNLSWDGATDMIFFIATGGLISQTFNILDGQWHFFRVSLNNVTGAMILQMDNGAAFAGVNPVALAPAPVPQFGVIFSDPGGGSMICDEIAIWDRILTAVELNLLYNGGTGTTWPLSP